MDTNNLINLFVACPKNSDNLKKQKQDIKEICLNLNIDFANEGRNIKIVPVTYDDPERREEVGKKHVKFKADIVICLVDDELDEIIVEDLKRAAKYSSMRDRPDLLVYSNNSTSDEKIEQIIGQNGWIYYLPKNEEDFKESIKKKLTEYARQYKYRRLIQRLIKGLNCFIILLLVSLIVGAFFYLKAIQHRLLIVGGGSARRYIEESLLQQKDGLKTMFWLYAPMPSGDSYRIMAEEIIKNYEDYKNRPYYPIVISSQKATGDRFTRNYTNKEFYRKGIVIGIHLADDPLVVYTSKNAIDSCNTHQGKAIETAVLNSIIEEQVPILLQRNPLAIDSLPIIFTTSENSGTLNNYLKTCGNAIINSYLRACDSIKEHHFFSDIDTLSRQNPGKEWIALGSLYYPPKNDKNDTIFKLTLCDNESIVEPKQIYVYFMLYKDEHNNTYVLPKATKGFVETLYNKQNNNKNTKESFESYINRIYDTILNNNQNGTRILYDNFTLSHE